jgi:hypothetical protein
MDTVNHAIYLISNSGIEMWGAYLIGIMLSAYLVVGALAFDMSDMDTSWEDMPEREEIVIVEMIGAVSIIEDVWVSNDAEPKDTSWSVSHDHNVDGFLYYHYGMQFNACKDMTLFEIM